jgi:hypothetical protein
MPLPWSVLGTKVFSKQGMYQGVQLVAGSAYGACHLLIVVVDPFELIKPVT